MAVFIFTIKELRKVKASRLMNLNSLMVKKFSFSKILHFKKNKIKLTFMT